MQPVVFQDFFELNMIAKDHCRRHDAAKGEQSDVMNLCTPQASITSS